MRKFRYKSTLITWSSRDNQSSYPQDNRQAFQKGFTLVEILVVLVIIGILAAIGLRSFSGAQLRARDANRKADLDNIANALEMYHNDYGQYPLSSDLGEIIGCGGEDDEWVACGWGSPFEDYRGTYYMVQLPQDPLVGLRYYYYSENGVDFRIFARLENLDDRDIVHDESTGEPLFYVGTSCGEALLCNYGVKSTNVVNLSLGGGMAPEGEG